MPSTQEIEQKNQSNSRIKQIIRISLYFVLGLVVLTTFYSLFSYMKPDSKYSFFIVGIVGDNPHPRVQGTVLNAYISVLFQNDIDETTAEDILANYAKENAGMFYKVFQGRVCSLSLKPLTTNIDSEIANLEPKAKFDQILKVGYEGHYAIQTMAVNQDCNLFRSQLESLGYEIIASDNVPVRAKVYTDVNKRKSLLELLKKDNQFQGVSFYYIGK